MVSQLKEDFGVCAALTADASTQMEYRVFLGDVIVALLDFFLGVIS